MAIGMVVGFGAALLLDRQLRKRREARAERERRPPREVAIEAAELEDEELAARVRVEVGVPPHIEVTAVEGAVVLFGRVPRYALAPLLARAARVEGVAAVEDRLTPVDDFDDFDAAESP